MKGYRDDVHPKLEFINESDFLQREGGFIHLFWYLSIINCLAVLIINLAVANVMVISICGGYW